jgi:hypothetical protein
MKNIAEMLGGAQLALGVSFDFQDAFEEYLSEEQRALLILLRLTEEDVPIQACAYGGRGRILRGSTFRAAIGKSFLQMLTTDRLIGCVRRRTSKGSEVFFVFPVGQPFRAVSLLLPRSQPWIRHCMPFQKATGGVGLSVISSGRQLKVTFVPRFFGGLDGCRLPLMPGQTGAGESLRVTCAAE